MEWLKFAMTAVILVMAYGFWAVLGGLCRIEDALIDLYHDDLDDECDEEEPWRSSL